MKLSCPVCDESVLSKSYPYINEAFTDREAKELFDRLKIHVCPGCGFGFSYPFLDAAKLDVFYRNQYRARGRRRRHLVSPSKDSKYGIRGAAQWSLAKMFLKDEGALSVLDVGTGAGDALMAAKELFPQSELYAVEADSYCWPVLEGNGVHVFKESFTPETAKRVDRTFDVILMSHILEHYNGCDLREITDALRRLLSDGGICVIEVPAVDMRIHHNARVDDSPHLSFFSVDSLRRLLEKDFEVLFCRGCGPKYMEYANYARSELKKKSEVLKRVRYSKFKTAVKTIIRISKDMLRRVPVVNGIFELKGKIANPSYYDHIAGIHYMYGEDRDFMRAVIRKKS